MSTNVSQWGCKMTASKKSLGKQWKDMSTLERAEYCEMIALGYSYGWCKDRVLEQAAALRLKAEKENKKSS